MHNFLSFAHQLADISAEILRQAFRNPANLTSIKADASPVTIADKAVEEALRNMIMQHYPTHGVIGEEEAAHQPDADYQWVIDPIDGTKAFACGIPTFTTLIGLMHKGEMLLGMVNQPITNERWWCDAGQTYLNGNSIHTANTAELATAKLATTSPYLFSDAEKPVFEKLRVATAIQSYGGDAYNYMMLASGQIDLVLEAGLKPYDILPLLPVLQAAGASVTDWQGRQLIPSGVTLNVLVSANEALHQHALEIMNKA